MTNRSIYIKRFNFAVKELVDIGVAVR